jgi:hypothetical protein
MNNKIKQLAQDAGFVLWANEEWNPGDVIDWASNYDQEIVKYTELVIKSVVDSIREISKTEAVITHENLKQRIFELYGDSNE